MCFQFQILKSILHALQQNSFTKGCIIKMVHTTHACNVRFMNELLFWVRSIQWLTWSSKKKKIMNQTAPDKNSGCRNIYWQKHRLLFGMFGLILKCTIWMHINNISNGNTVTIAVTTEWTKWTKLDKGLNLGLFLTNKQSRGFWLFELQCMNKNFITFMIISCFGVFMVIF